MITMQGLNPRLRELLMREIYPHCYVHKFIGHQTPAFAEAVSGLELAFPRAQRVAARESGKMAGGGRYISYTYELQAQSADEIMALLEATAQLADLKLIL